MNNDNNDKNIFDYIDAVGDRSFKEFKFNKVDSLVLCAMSYFKFGRYVSKSEIGDEGVSLAEMAESEDHVYLFRDERYHEINEKLFDALAGSRRFGGIRLKDYFDIINTGMTVQFSAMTVILDEELTYVLFRGTDDNIVGWKEDFNMMFKGPVPAQKMAKGYLERVADKIEGDFYVGGHSKGGNLAIYSSSCVSKKIQDRIIKIYSHDGPGFTEEFFRSSEYQNIKDRIVKQVPKNSIFGLWLMTPETYEIVSSEGEGVEQHSPFRWHIDESCWNEFVYEDRLDEDYVTRQKIFNEWVSKTDSLKALETIEIVFNLIDEVGISNMNDLNDRDKVFSGGMKMIAEVRKLDDSKKQKVIELMKLYHNIRVRENEKAHELRREKRIEEVKTEIRNARKEVRHFSSEIRRTISIKKPD